MSHFVPLKVRTFFFLALIASNVSINLLNIIITIKVWYVVSFFVENFLRGLLFIVFGLFVLFIIVVWEYVERCMVY